VREADDLPPSYCRTSRKSGALTYPKPPWPLQSVVGVTFYPQHRIESSITSRFTSQNDVETRTQTPAQLTSISQSRRIALMRGWSPGCLENKFSSRSCEDISSLWHMSSQTCCALAHFSTGSGDKRSERGVSGNVIFRNLK
jgi:hypothetical protein